MFIQGATFIPDSRVVIVNSAMFTMTGKTRQSRSFLRHLWKSLQHEGFSSFIAINDVRLIGYFLSKWVRHAFSRPFNVTHLNDLVMAFKEIPSILLYTNSFCIIPDVN